MGYSLKSFISSVAIGLGVAFSLSYAANAQVIFGTLQAEITTNTTPDPNSGIPSIALGEDLEISACSSAFEDSFSSNTFSLCDVPTVSDVLFEFTVNNLLAGTSTNFFAPVLTLTTGGVGDFINTAGLYQIFLEVSALSGAVDLGVNGIGQILGSSTSDTNSIGFIVNAASVPEPESLLLLVPALLMIGRRQRRLMKSRKDV